MLHYQGEQTLIDCGEGTQVAIRRAGCGFRAIRRILLTYYHGDHVSGLPGLLLTIGNANRTEPVEIVGPKGLRRIVEGLLVIAPQLPFPLEYRELTQDFQTFAGSDGAGKDLLFSAQLVEHSIECYAYRVDLPRAGKFYPQRAKALGVPLQQWSQLQTGTPVMVKERLVFPQEVMGPLREGIRLVYTTDLRPSPAVVALAQGAELFVCEGNYGDPEKQAKALEYQHTMFTEAAQMAKDAGVKELWLTHFSPSLTQPEDYLPLAREIFPNTHIHRHHTNLGFPKQQEEDSQ